MKNAENAIMRKEAVDKFCQLEKLVNQKNWSETNPLALVLQKAPPILSSLHTN